MYKIYITLSVSHKEKNARPALYLIHVRLI